MIKSSQTCTGSAMGPLAKLLEHGATVVCIELAGEKTWKRIVSLARDSSGQACLLYSPNP